jgi:hypothetical protein
MTQSKSILAAAQDIRPHLAALLNPEIAQDVDSQLQTLLTQAEFGQSVEIKITETLRNHQSTQEWMRRYLKGEHPVLITRSISSYSGLPGDSAPSVATKYVCPHNDYTWYQEDTNAIPLCPNHLVPLITAQS